MVKCPFNLTLSLTFAEPLFKGSFKRRLRRLSIYITKLKIKFISIRGILNAIYSFRVCPYLLTCLTTLRLFLMKKSYEVIKYKFVSAIALKPLLGNLQERSFFNCLSDNEFKKPATSNSDRVWDISIARYLLCLFAFCGLFFALKKLRKNYEQ